MSARRLKSTASRLFTQPFIQSQIQKNSKFCLTDFCVGNSQVTGEFPAQKASNAENVSIWWRHQEKNMSGTDEPVQYINISYDQRLDYRQNDKTYFSMGNNESVIIMKLQLKRCLGLNLNLS